jgi:anti-anti-sigma factor
MKITQHELTNGVIVLELVGRLNMVSTSLLRETVHTVVDHGSARIAIDLSNVDFVDSSGLGALVSGLKTARQAGGDLRIAGVNDQVRLVLSLTNLERVLTPYDSVEDTYAQS